MHQDAKNISCHYDYFRRQMLSSDLGKVKLRLQKRQTKTGWSMAIGALFNFVPREKAKRHLLSATASCFINLITYICVKPKFPFIEIHDHIHLPKMPHATYYSYLNSMSHK